MEKQIQIMGFRQLDARKWNQCVFSAAQGTVFGAYEYLSGMAGNWHGLVVGDYEAVLPLLTRTKWGIRYLSVIPFVRQLGLMGHFSGSAESLLAKIQGFCRYGDIGFNHGNGWLFDIGTSRRLNDKVTDGRRGAEKVYENKYENSNEHSHNHSKWARPNYVIDLCPGYAVISQGYRKSLRKRLRQTAADGLYLVENVSSVSVNQTKQTTGQDSVLMADVVHAYRDFIQSKMAPDDYHLNKDFERLEALLQTTFGQQYFHAYAVMDPSGELLLLGVYALDDHTIFKMMSVCVGAGREKNAMAFAVDALIQKYAGQPLCFDFMGSSLPGVQEFIHGFGATLAPYYLYHYNQLPWPLKMMKK